MSVGGATRTAADGAAITHGCTGITLYLIGFRLAVPLPGTALRGTLLRWLAPWGPLRCVKPTTPLPQDMKFATNVNILEASRGSTAIRSAYGSAVRAVARVTTSVALFVPVAPNLAAQPQHRAPDSEETQRSHGSSPRGRGQVAAMAKWRVQTHGLWPNAISRSR